MNNNEGQTNQTYQNNQDKINKVNRDPQVKDPHIGVGIFVADVTNNKILIGKRLQGGNLAQPGGWLERYETWEECGKRELMEETNIDITSERLIHISTYNCLDIENYGHNVAVQLYCEINEKEIELIKNVEPDKCEGWFWVDLPFVYENIDKLFLPMRMYFQKYKGLKNVSELYCKQN